MFAKVRSHYSRFASKPAPHFLHRKKTLHDRKQDRKIAKLTKSIRAEDRIHIVTIANTGTIAGNNRYALNLLAIGDGNGTREGSNIRIWQCEVDGYAINADTGANGTNESSNILRIMLTTDKANNGALTTSADIIQDPLTGDRIVNSQKNYVNCVSGKVIKVEADRKINVSKTFPFAIGVPVVGYQLPVRRFHINKKFKNGRLVQYSGDTAAQGDVRNGQLQLNFMCNTDRVIYWAYIRIRYTP